jgi:hypothetical protein
MRGSIQLLFRELPMKNDIEFLPQKESDNHSTSERREPSDKQLVKYAKRTQFVPFLGQKQ